MAEPISTGGIAWATKAFFFTYVFPPLMAFGGATAHILEEVNQNGWKGWIYTLSSGFVAFFAGMLILAFAYRFYPEYAGGITGLGAFYGVKSINILFKILSKAKEFSKTL